MSRAPARLVLPWLNEVAWHASAGTTAGTDQNLRLGVNGDPSYLMTRGWLKLHVSCNIALPPYPKSYAYAPYRWRSRILFVNVGFSRPQQSLPIRPNPLTFSNRN
ncbi:hypothetical protein F5Y01DRAFT_6922 [Xylaria sp. FL0043]|nr:hypothetical protein F5Y01DRAFT_6922 [Xylaria sp. FL0043]